MNKRVTKVLNIESLKPDFILTKDIYNYNSNAILYKKGTVLTVDKINKLKKFGNISVEVNFDKDINIKQSNEKIVQKNIELDFNNIYDYANYIVLSVLNNNDVKQMLTKIDTGLYDHSRKVALLSTMIGMHLENFDQYKLEQLAITSLLHDVGKSVIDFSVVNKPGKLTNEEFEIMKEHSQKGYDILTKTQLFSSNICDSVLSHHENEDGTGYPNNLRESEIPLYSRIIHICDVYAALTAKRCYKSAWSSEQAIKILEKDKSKFEPNLLNIFKTSLPIYMKDDIVYLSTNELGKVLESNNNGALVKIFGEKKVINIGYNNDNVYVKRKIKVR